MYDQNLKFFLILFLFHLFQQHFFFILQLSWIAFSINGDERLKILSLFLSQENYKNFYWQLKNVLKFHHNHILLLFLEVFLKIEYQK